MKYAIFFAATLMFMGCAGTKKETPPPPPPPAANPAPAPKDMSNDNKVMCKKDDDSRTLEVVKKGKGCELKYTKAGKTSNAATSSHGDKHCRDVETKIQGKLEKAGYLCG